MENLMELVKRVNKTLTSTEEENKILWEALKAKELMLTAYDFKCTDEDGTFPEQWSDLSDYIDEIECYFPQLCPQAAMNDHLIQFLNQTDDAYQDEDAIVHECYNGVDQRCCRRFLMTKEQWNQVKNLNYDEAMNFL